MRWIFGAAALFFIMLETLALTGMATNQAEPQNRRFTLYVRDGWLSMPDGQQLYVWGFTDDPAGQPKIPGPPIVVNEGDVVEVTLVNDRDPTASTRLPSGEGHTIHLHGLDVPPEHDGVPETFPAGLVRQGGSYTYRFTATHAGTYFYHCHQNNVEHQQMGMFGAIVVRAANGAKTAYTGGPAYDREATIVLSEMGQEGHEEARRAYQEGAAPYNWLRYQPTYYFLDSKPFTDAASIGTFLDAVPGERVLVRVINAGYVAHGIRAPRQRFTIVASDGRPFPTPQVTDVVWLGPGEKYDLLFHADESGLVAVVDDVNQAIPNQRVETPSESGDLNAAADVQRFSIYVRDGTLGMPDGAQIFTYGFTDSAEGAAKVPGPALVVRAGETVEVTLINDADPTDTGHGFALGGLGAVVEGPEKVAPGETGVYRFSALRPGSYFYFDPTAPEHQQMGLYGALVVLPAAGGSAFDQEFTMVLSEMDSVGHEKTREALALGSEGYDWRGYAPNYFLINGLAFPDTEHDPGTMVHTRSGERLLIRAINAGQRAHSMHLHGYHFRIAAINGVPWPDSPLKDTALIRPGESYDLVFDVDQDGLFPFHDHFEVANTNNGVWLGGMHTLVAAGVPHPAEPAAPVAAPFDGPTVAVRDNFYNPNVLTVPVGTTVRWDHQGRVEHTVTNLNGLFDSGVLSGGDQFFQQFIVPGRYDYFCRFHITNRGSITVQ